MAKKYYILLSLAMLCMLVAGALQSAQALLVKPILDDIFLGKNPNALKWIPLAVIGIFLVKGACNYGQTIMMNYIGLRRLVTMRKPI